jgi:hypothetical protein
LLLLPFFDEEPLEDDFFDAAILLTTFHAVRDLPVAPTWQKTPDRSGKLKIERCGEKKRRPSTLTERCSIQFLAIVIFLYVIWNA